MSQLPPQLPLLKFTFYSLQFCATSVSTWRGKQFLTAVNQWYVPFIQSGWTVPLSLSIDLAGLLLNPRDVPRRFGGDQSDSPRLKELANRYRQTLDSLRRKEEVRFVTELVQTTRDPVRQNQVIRAFLEVMFSSIAGMKNVYSFSGRDFFVQKAAISSRGVQLVVRGPTGETQQGTVGFGAAHKVVDSPEGQATCKVLDLWCRFFQERPLAEVITPELCLVLELTATTSYGKGRVDYVLLNWLLHRPAIEEVEETEIAPRVVDEEEPTNPFQIEGPTGGYIDMQRRRFSGSLGEVLPVELGLWRVKPLMLQKLLNEGMLTYVRENFEYIDRELRMLFCFVIDNDAQMLLTRPDRHPDLPKGLTPYIRARALAARMLQDLSRFLPRHNVSVDCGVFLWSSGRHGPRGQDVACTAEVDLFGPDRATSANQFRFLRRLIDEAPELFYSKLGQSDAQSRPHLEREPAAFIHNRHQRRRYHCRHIVLLTSADTERNLVDAIEADLAPGPSGPDSLFIVHCDVSESTFAVSCPEYVGPSGPLTQLGETALRQTFLETVMQKAAGKPLMSSLIETTELLS